MNDEISLKIKEIQLELLEIISDKKVKKQSFITENEGIKNIKKEINEILDKINEETNEAHNKIYQKYNNKLLDLNENLLALIKLAA